MWIWYLIYVIVIACALYNKKYIWALPVALAVSAVADGYGFPIGNSRFSAFSTYIFISSIIYIPKSIKLIRETFAQAFKSPLLKLLLLVISGSFLNSIFIDGNIFILIKYLIYFSQAYIIFLLYIESQKSLNFFLKNLLAAIAIVSFTVIAFQKFGPHVYYFVASTTYDINEIRESGYGYGRPYGLSREPAHLVAIELLSLVLAANISTSLFLFICLIWYFISIWSETRSIFLAEVIFAVYYFFYIITSKQIKFILFAVTAPLLIYATLVNERLNTILSFTSDESTLIRYGTLIAITYHGFTEPFLPVSYGSLLIDFCENSAHLFRPLENICTYRDIRLNWSLDFIFSLPYYAALIFTIAIYKNEKVFQVNILIALFLSGLVFYIWANPAPVIALSLSMIYLHDEKTTHKNCV